MTESTPRPADLMSLYRRAFEEFGASALWSSRPVPDPTLADVLAITYTLRVEGDLQARRLAEQIEQACRAALEDLERHSTAPRGPEGSSRAAGRWLRAGFTFSFE